MIIEAQQTAKAFSGVLGQVATPAVTPSRNEVTDSTVYAQHAVRLALRAASAILSKYGVSSPARRQSSRTEIPYSVYDSIVRTAKAWTGGRVPRLYIVDRVTYSISDPSVARAAGGRVESVMRSYNYYPSAVPRATPPLITEPERPQILRNEVRDPRVYAEHAVRYTLRRLAALIRAEGVQNPVGKQARRTVLSFKLYDRVVIDARKWIKAGGGADFPRYYNLEGKTYAVRHIVAIRAEDLVPSILSSYNYFEAEPLLAPARPPVERQPIQRPPTVIVQPPPVTRPRTPEEKWGPVEEVEVQLTPTTPTAPNYYALVHKALDAALARSGLAKSPLPQRVRLTESQLTRIFRDMKPIIMESQHWGPESDRENALSAVGYYPGTDRVRPRGGIYSILRDRGYFVYTMPGAPTVTPVYTPLPSPTPVITRRPTPSQMAKPLIEQAVTAALAAKGLAARAATRTGIYRTTYDAIRDDAYSRYRVLERSQFRREIIERGVAWNMVTLELQRRNYWRSYVAPAPAVTPTKTPTIVTALPTYTPMPEPTPTPTPVTPVVTREPNQADIINMALDQALGGRNLAARPRRRVYLTPQVYDGVVVEATALANQMGRPRFTTAPSQVLYFFRQRRYMRRAPSITTVVTRRPTPTVTPVTTYPIPDYVPPYPTPVTIRRPPVRRPAAGTFAQLLRESVERMLTKYRIPMQASSSSPYWVEDVRWRELVGDIVAEAGRLAMTEQYRQPQQAMYGGLSVSREQVVSELRRRYILPESERIVRPPIEPIVTTPVRRILTLEEWASTAPIFGTYQECAAAGLQATGRTPDRWRHCLTEADAVTQAVSHALNGAGIATYPGSLAVSAEQYDGLVRTSLDISSAMVTQRTYSPMFQGQRLAMFRAQ